MTGPLNTDGDFVIYTVEVERTRSSATGWCQVWQDWTVLYHEGPPVPSIPVRYADAQAQRNGSQNEPFSSFSSGGECWQRTGLYGAFELDKAQALVAVLLLYQPTLKLRVIERRISQRTRVVGQVTASPRVRLINDALDAEHYFTPDELEEHADRQRRATTCR